MTQVTDDDVLEMYRTRPFEQVEARLYAVREHLLDAPTEVVATALLLSDINAIVSANTPVGAHEVGTMQTWEAIQSGNDGEAQLADALDARSPDGSKAVLYYNNKAEYIHRNMVEVDYTEHAELYQDKRFEELQERMARNVTGLGMRKAGFSLANLGAVECCCIDNVLCRGLDIDSQRFNTVLVERYYNEVEGVQERTPKAAEQLPRYIWQWAIWSVIRPDGFTPHDPWFALLDDTLEADILDPEPPAQPAD